MEQYSFFDKFILFAFLAVLSSLMFEIVVAYRLVYRAFSEDKISEGSQTKVQMQFFSCLFFVIALAVSLYFSKVLSCGELFAAIVAGRWLTYVVILYKIKCNSWWFMAVYAAPVVLLAFAVGIQSWVMLAFAVISGGFLHWAKQFLFKNVTMRYFKLLKKEFVIKEE